MLWLRCRVIVSGNFTARLNLSTRVHTPHRGSPFVLGPVASPLSSSHPGPSCPSQHCPLQISTTLETRYSSTSGSCPTRLFHPRCERLSFFFSPSLLTLESGGEIDHCEALSLRSLRFVLFALESCLNPPPLTSSPPFPFSNNLAPTLGHLVLAIRHSSLLSDWYNSPDASHDQCLCVCVCVSDQEARTE